MLYFWAEDQVFYGLDVEAPCRGVLRLTLVLPPLQTGSGGNTVINVIDQVLIDANVIISPRRRRTVIVVVGRHQIALQDVVEFLGERHIEH